MDAQMLMNILTAALSRRQVRLHHEINQLLKSLREEGQTEFANEFLNLLESVPNGNVEIYDMLVEEGKADPRMGLSENHYADYWNLLANTLPPDSATGADPQHMHKRQFKFLVDECKLKTTDYFLDIGVGSLRGTRLIIPYLEEGHFFGMDVASDLIEFSRNRVATTPEFAEKKPRLEIDDRFRVQQLFPDQTFDFVFSKSVLTHLYPGSVWEVLTRVRPVIRPDGVYYATIFKDNDTKVFRGDIGKIWFNTDWLAETAEVCGWKLTEIGKTNIGQYMVRFDPI
jgi:SAM-dependent methyltransferase